MTRQIGGASAIHGIDIPHSERVSRFVNDLRALEVRHAIQKHITTGNPVGLDERGYFELRQTIGSQFDIHPSAAAVVGSCRTGFSLKLKGPKEARARYHPYDSDSDIDVAIVSAALFDHYWDRVFEKIGPNRSWAMANGKKFSQDLFYGWITPGDLPSLPTFDQAKVWTEFFDKLNQARTHGLRKVSARLYRTWERLEAYQAHLVRECKSELFSENIR